VFVVAQKGNVGVVQQVERAKDLLTVLDVLVRGLLQILII